MIEQKTMLFMQGIGLFAMQVCRGNRDAYIQGMVHQGGYVEAAKKFFLYSAYLTKEDADALLQHNIVPKWMGEICMEVERKCFNTTIWDKQ